MRRRLQNKETLTAEQLASLRAELSALDDRAIEIRYQATHNACRLHTHVPPPVIVQELVQVWRELWRRRRR